MTGREAPRTSTTENCKIGEATLGALSYTKRHIVRSLLIHHRLTIARLSHTSVYVLDQERAYDFYVNKLGIEAVFKDDSGNWFSLGQKE